MRSRTLARVLRTVVVVGIALPILAYSVFVATAGALSARLTGGPPRCTSCQPPCLDLSAHVPNPVMTDSESQTLTLTISHDPANPSCSNPETVRVGAPGLTVSPPGVSPNITLPLGGVTTLEYIIVPNHIGAFQITFSTGDNYAHVGITVISGLGLPAPLAQYASYAGIALGLAIALLGLFFRRRRKRIPQKPEEVKVASTPRDTHPARGASPSH
jgi:hypothetical protein